MNVNDSLIKPYLHYIFPEKPTKILDETSRKWKELEPSRANPISLITLYT